MIDERDEEEIWPEKIEHATARDVLIEYLYGCNGHQMASVYSFVAMKTASILIDGKTLCTYDHGENAPCGLAYTKRMRESAPELLDACEQLLSIVEAEYEDDPEREDLVSWKRAIEQARKAINKAIGKE